MQSVLSWGFDLLCETDPLQIATQVQLEGERGGRGTNFWSLDGEGALEISGWRKASISGEGTEAEPEDGLS